VGAEPDDCLPVTFPFGRGDTLLMFTDGVVERRTEIIDCGLKRAEQSADLLRAEDLRSALARFVAQVHGDDADDDITALAMRAG